MLAELLHTTTTDGLRLDGALLKPATEFAPPLAIDAAICLPGVGANFYGSTMLADLARPLLASGSAVLWANSRGHDLVYTAASPGGARRQGASYEIVDDCRHDLAAWCSLLGERGYGRIGLIGHSLGAIKSAYAAAYAEGLSMERVVAISPPRLCYSLFKQADIRRYVASIEQAEDLVAAGEGQTLIEARFPFPLLITAASYVDKYGSAERYDIGRFAAALPCPALFLYGSEELASGGIAFREVDQLIGSLSEQAKHALDVQVIQGANHFYSGKREELANAVADWLQN